MGSAFRWRKSSYSGETGACVELGIADWRKSSFSGGTGACVELANVGAIRDSKDPHGPVIRVGLDRFVASIKMGRFER